MNEFYWIKSKFLLTNFQAVVEYRKKHRPLKVKLIDASEKTVMIDDSLLVGEILTSVCKKALINNPDEYGLRIFGSSEGKKNIFIIKTYFKKNRQMA